MDDWLPLVFYGVVAAAVVSIVMGAWAVFRPPPSKLKPPAKLPVPAARFTSRAVSLLGALPLAHRSKSLARYDNLTERQGNLNKNNT